MLDTSPQSPEARRKRPHPAVARGWIGARTFEVVKRVLVGVYNDGFIHAGNLAYLSLVALFPFFIVAAAVARIFGRTEDGLASVNAFLSTVPDGVAGVLRPAIESVLMARETGTGIVWLGIAVALWTTGSLIETIRDILRRAYGVTSGRPFWEYRLRSVGIIFGSIFLTMFAFSLQVMLMGTEQFLIRVLPFADDAIAIVSATKMVPMAVLCLALWSLFLSLTPSKYRGRSFPKWPGAVLTAIWWYATTLLLPVALSGLTSYDMTYGSLAGVMITLIFFFIVGLGVVIGAELNAALAEFPTKKSAEAAELFEEMQEKKET